MEFNNTTFIKFNRKNNLSLFYETLLDIRK